MVPLLIITVIHSRTTQLFGFFDKFVFLSFRIQGKSRSRKLHILFSAFIILFLLNIFNEFTSPKHPTKKTPTNDRPRRVYWYLALFSPLQKTQSMLLYRKCNYVCSSERDFYHVISISWLCISSICIMYIYNLYRSCLLNFKTLIHCPCRCRECLKQLKESRVPTGFLDSSILSLWYCVFGC